MVSQFHVLFLERNVVLVGCSEETTPNRVLSESVTVSLSLTFKDFYLFTWNERLAGLFQQQVPMTNVCK